MPGPHHHAAKSFTHVSGKLLRQLLLACWVLTGLVACGSATVGGGYNATTPTNIFEAQLFDQLESNVVVIASVNLGGPSRNYLKKREAFVDSRVQEYLEDAGYELRPQREFSQRWNNAVLIYGDPIDPTTGRVNQKSFIQIVQAVRDQLREQTDISSIVFTDIIEKEIYYEQGMNRVTRFDGVTRKPAIQGAGSGVTSEFDWSRPVAAATMRVAWFNMDLGRIFSGEGGMEVTDAVDTRSGTAFVRRRDVLENENQIDEGIAIAFHPIIAMKNWPGNP
ncbi:MAG: hypothetical protein P8I86_08895 [Luminiphilus sp.]|jgi:hypothetical protein|nr:hypothetical protein [Luminiphilus sp.]MDG2037683.1 hypothetical protein [Luminiphilus sp.]